jgi:hypothetical protein
VPTIYQQLTETFQGVGIGGFFAGFLSITKHRWV